MGPGHCQMCGLLALQDPGSSTSRVRQSGPEEGDRRKVTFSGQLMQELPRLLECTPHLPPRGLSASHAFEQLTCDFSTQTFSIM